jgi:hypothetical protein
MKENIDNSQHVLRKNKGHMMYPPLNVNKSRIIQHYMKTRSKRKSKIRTTRNRNKSKVVVNNMIKPRIITYSIKTMIKGKPKFKITNIKRKKIRIHTENAVGTK